MKGALFEKKCPLHPKMLCAKFGWKWPFDSGEDFCFILSMHFRYFVIISPWEKTWPFIWTNLNPLHPKMRCAKFSWNRLCSSGEGFENMKFTDGQQTNDRRSEKLTWPFSSEKPKKLQNCAKKLTEVFIKCFFSENVS